jgi:V8-like Glu-specific endopeptidase
VSNEPEHRAEVPAAEAISQPPFEGEGFGRVFEESVQQGNEGVEEVPGYEQSRNALTRSLMDPKIVLAAPETIDLRPIAEASFGPLAAGQSSLSDGRSGVLAMQESIQGDRDDRIQLADTAAYPWRAHASLLITAANNSQWIGTGWFIGPRTLITAGHCVYINETGPAHGWVRSIQVMPGRNGSSLPYGSITSTEFRSVDGWTVEKDQNYDYGAIIVPSDLGNIVGWLGFGVWPDDELLASTANIAGYPGDKPRGTQWFHARQVVSVSPLKVFYDIDTAGGQSGTAVFRLVDGDRYAIAHCATAGRSDLAARIVRYGPGLTLPLTTRTVVTGGATHDDGPRRNAFSSNEPGAVARLFATFAKGGHGVGRPDYCWRGSRRKGRPGGGGPCVRREGSRPRARPGHAYGPQRTLRAMGSQHGNIPFGSCFRGPRWNRIRDHEGRCG